MNPMSNSKSNFYPYPKVSIVSNKYKLGLPNGINLNKIGTGNTMPKNMYNKPNSIKK